MSTSVTPLPSTVTAQASAIGPYYGLVYLYLAAAAYTDSPGACSGVVVRDITNLIENTLPPLPAGGQSLPIGTPETLAGTWKITWVPQFSANNYANLMFAATFYDEQSQPVIMVVSIRGTDTSSGSMGLLQQLKEDVTDDTLYNWNKIAGVAPQNLPATMTADIISGDPKVATGSYKGLYDLMQFQAQYMIELGSLQSETLNIADYVDQFSVQWPACPIIVTGHSLGGCQATIVSLYLNSLYPNANILPNPFAPPTAGNTKFASDWVNAFTTKASTPVQLFNIWINPIDLVPNAFQTLANIYTLWDQYAWPSNPNGTQKGPPVPLVTVGALLAAIIAAATLTDDDHYGQLPVASNIALAWAIPDWESVIKPFLAQVGIQGDLWLDMLLWQHFPPCYYALMTTQQILNYLVPFDRCPSIQCVSAPTPAPNPDPNGN